VNFHQHARIHRGYKDSAISSAVPHHTASQCHAADVRCCSERARTLATARTFPTVHFLLLGTRFAKAAARVRWARNAANHHSFRTCFANEGLPRPRTSRMHAGSQPVHMQRASLGACISIKQVRVGAKQIWPGGDTPCKLSCPDPCTLPSPQRASEKPGSVLAGTCLAVLDPAIRDRQFMPTSPVPGSSSLPSLHSIQSRTVSLQCAGLSTRSLFAFSYCIAIACRFAASSVSGKVSFASASEKSYGKLQLLHDSLIVVHLLFIVSLLLSPGACAGDPIRSKQAICDDLVLISRSSRIVPPLQSNPNVDFTIPRPHSAARALSIPHPSTFERIHRSPLSRTLTGTTVSAPTTFPKPRFRRRSVCNTLARFTAMKLLMLFVGMY